MLPELLKCVICGTDNYGTPFARVASVHEHYEPNPTTSATRPAVRIVQDGGVPICETCVRGIKRLSFGELKDNLAQNF